VPHSSDEEDFGEDCLGLGSGDEGNHDAARGKGDTPVGVLRFKAGAEAWRRRLQRQLLLAPLTASDRERITRWLNNLRGRAAWQAARLEHTVATKRLLLDALNGEEPPRPPRSGPADGTAPGPKTEKTTDGVVLRHEPGGDNRREHDEFKSFVGRPSSRRWRGAS
jgi:hypothetical protein